MSMIPTPRNPLRTAPGLRLGTPAYIAPEQAFAKEIDTRTDLYSVGVILFEMLTGHKPFRSDTDRGLCLEHLHTSPKPVNSIDAVLAIDQQIENLLLSLMAKDRAKRPQTARAAIRIIDEVRRELVLSIRIRRDPCPVCIRRLHQSIKQSRTKSNLNAPPSSLPAWIYPLIGGLLIGAMLAVFLFLSAVSQNDELDPTTQVCILLA